MIRPHQKSPDYGKRDEFVELAASREAFFSEAAKKLGFLDPFDREQRHAFMDGRHPGTDYKLGRHQSNANESLYCLTWAPGIEFTNLKTILNDEGRAALDKCASWAFEDVVAVMEGLGAEIRRGAAGVTKERAGLLAMGVVHERNSNDEPFLHVEGVFSRHGVAKSDGTAHVLDNPFKIFYQNAQKLEETFQLSFGKHVEEYLGIRCDLERGKTVVAGLDPVYKETRSTRGEQIRESIKEAGKAYTPENREQAARFTRDDAPKKPAEQLHKEWSEKAKSDGLKAPKTDKPRGLFKALWEDHVKEIAKTAKAVGKQWCQRRNDIIRVRDVDRFIKAASFDNQRGYREARKSVRESKSTAPIALAYEAARDFLTHRQPELQLGKQDRVVIAKSVILSDKQLDALRKIAERGVVIQWGGVSTDNHRIAKNTQNPRASKSEEGRARGFS